MKKTKTRALAWLLMLCLTVGLLPGMALAAEPAAATADFTASDGGAAALALLNAAKTGTDESTWDNSTNTLTLKGIDFTTTAATAVKLPAGTTIVLADGTENKIKSGDVAFNVSGEHNNQTFINAVDAAGNLTIRGGTEGTGILNIVAGNVSNADNGWSYSSGIAVYGDLIVEGGHVTAKGGRVQVVGDGGSAFSIGVNMDNEIKNKTLRVTGGSLTAIAGEAYQLSDANDTDPYPEFSRGVYLYRGDVSASGGGKLRAESVETMAEAGLLSSGLYVFMGDLLITDSAEVEAIGNYGVDVSGGGILLSGGKLTARSTQSADAYGNLGNAVYVGVEKDSRTSNNGNITVTGGTLETINGKIYMATFGAKENQGVFAVTGGSVVNSGRLYGAEKIDISGGTVRTCGIEADALAMSGGSVTVREPVRKSTYSDMLLVNAAVDVNSLTASGGALDAAWNWGAFTPILFPVDGYYGYRTPLVEMPYDFTAAVFNGGTVILDTGYAGNTALRLNGTLSLGTGVAETGADTSSAIEHSQEYTDTPVVFSDVSRTAVTVSGISAVDKIYDGTTAAELTAGSVTGVNGNDRVFLGSANVTANFNDANVGPDKEVKVTGGTFDLRGKDAYKYELSKQPTELTGLTATIAPCTLVEDATNRSQTVYTGEGTFDGAHFAGVEIGGAPEAATGAVRYTIGEDTEEKTGEEIAAYLKTLKAGDTADIHYNFDGTGNYDGASAGGVIKITVADRPVAPVTPAQPKITEKNCPKDGTCPLTRFADVPNNAWYHDALHYCVEHGLLSGTGESTFSPGRTMTRGMVVTVLHRLAGSPAPKGTAGFEDVAAGSYCDAATRWAAENGIVLGFASGKFEPEQPVTRAQLAVILCRYAALVGLDVTNMAELDGFADADAVGEWAREALGWASGAGIILGGKDGRIAPQGDATRAQTAVILYRFCTKLLGK